MRGFDLNNPDVLLQHLLSRGKMVDGCFVWQGFIGQGGYGVQQVSSKVYRVHRLIWLIKEGDIPENILVCHICDNRSCFLIDHLYLGTNKDNSLDMVKRKRVKYGEQNGGVVLSELEVKAIYALKGYASQAYIAKLYKVTQMTVSKIHRGVTWKHLNLKP